MNKKCAQSVCLSELVALHGGPAAFGRLVGDEGYVISNWKLIGKVPLHRVGKVARSLKVSTYLLNFEEVSDLNGTCPKWKEIVNQVGFSRKSLEAIFAAKAPKTI